MAEITVRIEEDCENCQGVGTVHDPTGFGWADLYKLDIAAFEREIAERGYRADDRSLPPEEGPCTDCDGSGRSSRPATLAELAALLEESQ